MTSGDKNIIVDSEEDAPDGNDVAIEEEDYIN